MTPWRLRHAKRVLDAGGLVAHPTEGVWGLACDPLHPAAVARLLAAKDRDPGKGLILIAHDQRALLAFLADEPERLERASATWPGPVTWLLRAAPDIPGWLTGNRSVVAVRVTDHPVASALCRTFGGVLVSTSANRSGRPTARNLWQVRRQLGDWVDFALAGACTRPGRPSTIIDAATGNIVRDGSRP